MAISKTVKRVCENCGHQWMATPPMKPPSKIGLESDLTYQGKRGIKADILRADYSAKLNAAHASKAAFETCVKCGSTGGVRTEYTPEQLASQEKSRLWKIRITLFFLTGGISEIIRLSIFVFKTIRSRRS